MFVDVFSSLTRVFIGGALGVVVGIVFGFLRAQFPQKWQENIFVNFVLDFIKYPPPIAWIPFAILIFGIGEKASYAIVFIGVFPPVFTQCSDAVRGIAVEIKKTVESMELNRWEKIKLIHVPYSMPRILTGIKIGLGMGWMSIIAAEMISGNSGLGYTIQLQRLNLQYTDMGIYIFLIGLVGFILNYLLNRIEKRIVKWN